MSRVTPVSSVRPAVDFVVEQARRRLEASGRRILVWGSGDGRPPAGEVAGPYDAAWIAPERLEGLDVGRLGRLVAALLRPGAPLVCVIPGCWPLHAVLDRALLGVGELPGPPRARLEGRPPRCISATAWRRAFGPDFSWQGARAVGLLVPARSSGVEVESRARVLGLLAAAEHVIGGWPFLRVLGDRILLEGVRR